jgi:site-specific DNA recombinase
MTKRIVIYLRVSSDEQAKNNSMDVQYDDCMTYAKHSDLEVVEVFREDYTGTVPFEQRPEGSKAYNMLKSGAADGVLVWRMNRLARPLDAGDEWAIPPLVQGLAKLGKEIHICDRGQIKTDFASLLIALLDARESGNDRRAILEKMAKGMRNKAKDGRAPCQGKAPYGYRFIIVRPDAKRPDGLEIYEPEAVQVRRIYDLYVNGNGSGPLTYRAIAELFSVEGIPSPGEAKKRPNKKRGAGLWAAPTVSRIIHNPAYKGYAEFGSIIYPVPSIVSEDIWARAQTRSEANKRLAERNSKREYLIGGMIKCKCGYQMTGMYAIGKSGKEVRYYHCNSASSHFFVGLETRHHHRVNADRGEFAAWQFLLDVVSERDKLYLWLKEAQALALEKVAPQRDQLESVTAMLAEAEVDAERTAREMRGIPESRRSGPTYKALEKQGREIDERYAGLEQVRSKLEAEIAAATITDESIANFTAFSEDAIAGLTNPDYATKRRWLDYLKVKVEVENKIATVSCMLPVESRCFDLRTASGMTSITLRP